jgi:hypothetical protein
MALGALVADIRAKGHTLQRKSLECMTHQQQLCLRIAAGSPRDAAEPCRADLNVGVLSVEIPVRSRADHGPIHSAQDCKRKPAIHATVTERFLDPGPCLLEACGPRIRKPSENLLGVRGG